jgi:hypothetical protein
MMLLHKPCVKNPSCPEISNAIGCFGSLHCFIKDQPITTFPAFALNYVVLLNEGVNFKNAALTLL